MEHEKECAGGHNGKEYAGTSVPINIPDVNQPSSGLIAAAAEHSAPSSQRWTCTGVLSHSSSKDDMASLRETEDDESAASTLLMLNNKSRAASNSDDPNPKRLALQTTEDGTQLPTTPHIPMHVSHTPVFIQAPFPGAQFSMNGVQIIPYIPNGPSAVQPPSSETATSAPPVMYQPQPPYFWNMQYPVYDSHFGYWQNQQAPAPIAQLAHQPQPVVMMKPRTKFKPALPTTESGLASTSARGSTIRSTTGSSKKSSYIRRPPPMENNASMSLPVLGLGVIKNGVSCVVRTSNTPCVSHTNMSTTGSSSGVSSFSEVSTPKLAAEGLLGVGVLKTDGASAVVRVGGLVGMNGRRWKIDEDNAAQVEPKPHQQPISPKRNDNEKGATGGSTLKRRRPRGK
ncbi:hypothetical protein BC830DRAFT_535777 [Chytriomyces sp. MP71]|nr:hypothetical protein BC830DRAFT_535777 [Chytriomyces sp. MP71]